MTTKQDHLIEDQLTFLPESLESVVASSTLSPWPVLIADDEPEVHAATSLALRDYSFEGRGLSLISAYSAADAEQILLHHPDIALILLDVVMESDHAGLDLVHRIRETLNNQNIRIILRTGQPGQAPQEKVIVTYDINDYKEKTELTSIRLFTAVTAALRGFRELKRRCAAEEALRLMNEELEERVKLRTTELLETNRNLTNEMAQRKRLQEQLIASERMATAGAMAGGISHEFNNINVSVLGWADIGLNYHEISPELANCLQKIRLAALRAKEITSNMIAFTSPSAGPTLKVDLPYASAQALNPLRGEFSDAGITIEEHYEPSLTCQANPIQISQVITNVLSNALHAMLTAEKRVLKVHGGREEGMVVLRFSDTGCGIPREAIGKVTLPFFSLKGEKASGLTPLSGVKGIGLGLSVAHTILRNLGGELRIESEEGRGTTVEIHLPMISAEEMRTTHPLHAANPSLKDEEALDILILEDETEVARLITYVLQTQGYKSLSTASGQEALSIIRSRPVKAILCDLQMPEMSGLEFIHKVDGLNLHPKPVSIAITGKILTTSDREIIDQSFYRMLSKPFQISDLKQCLKEALEKG